MHRGAILLGLCCVLSGLTGCDILVGAIENTIREQQSKLEDNTDELFRGEADRIRREMLESSQESLTNTVDELRTTDGQKKKTDEVVQETEE